MEAELWKAPASYRMSMLSKVRNYKRDVDQLAVDVVCCSVFVFLTVLLHWLYLSNFLHDPHLWCCIVPCMSHAVI